MRPLRALALAATLALAARPLAAQAPATRAPVARATVRWDDRVSPAAAAAFDPQRLARIDAWLAGLVAERRIPNAVAMIVKDGRVAYHKAFGVRDLATGAPVRPDDIFRLASQTKAITSLAVLMLWEEGKFGLDDPIARYLPAFERQTVLTKFNRADSTYEARPARRRTTIRQLLTHTGGLDYADIGSEDFRALYAKAGVTGLGREGDVLADRIDALGRLPLRQEPGERFTYSLSIDVLGRLVEVASGMPLDRFLRTRILDPLGMRDTWFELPADRRGRLVTLHTLDSARTLVPTHARTLGVHPDYPARPVTYFAGGAGLAGTTRDYARFLQLVLNGGELDGVRLVGRKTVELMLTNQLPNPLGSSEQPWGLGFALETEANDRQSPASVGSFSWGGAFETSYWGDPQEGIVALVYTNTFGVPVDLEGTFRTLVYQALR